MGPSITLPALQASLGILLTGDVLEDLAGVGAGGSFHLEVAGPLRLGGAGGLSLLGAGNTGLLGGLLRPGQRLAGLARGRLRPLVALFEGARLPQRPNAFSGRMCPPAPYRNRRLRDVRLFLRP
ncbi:MAG: hypothetical protein WD064_05445 [Acidimicrobiia bacterium]